MTPGLARFGPVWPATRAGLATVRRDDFSSTLCGTRRSVPASAEDAANLRPGRSAAGITPHVATFGYRGMLWPKVALFLLGCECGVAIVEHSERQELNPNVALERGWMKGIGRKVFFLVAQDFAHQRADWRGLRSQTCAWGAPDAGLRDAITAWLMGKEKVQACPPPPFAL